MAKATKTKPQARRNGRNSRNSKPASPAPVAFVKLDPPRKRPRRNRVVGSIGLKLPESGHCLDTFLVHPPGSFELDDLRFEGITEEQWEAARLLIGKNYVLGFCTDPEAAIVLASAVSLQIPQHVLFAYDDSEGILWVTLA